MATDQITACLNEQMLSYPVLNTELDIPFFMDAVSVNGYAVRSCYQNNEGAEQELLARLIQEKMGAIHRILASPFFLRLPDDGRRSLLADFNGARKLEIPVGEQKAYTYKLLIPAAITGGLLGAALYGSIATKGAAVFVACVGGIGIIGVLGVYAFWQFSSYVFQKSEREQITEKRIRVLRHNGH